MNIFWKSISKSFLSFFFIALVTTGCTNFTKDSLPPTFSLVSINVVESTLFEQKLEIGLRVKNPNDHPINVRGANAALEINAIPFADGFIREGNTIDAYSDEVFIINATTNLSRLLRQIGKIADTGVVDYALKGGLKIDNLLTPIPFNETGRFALDELFPGIQKLRLQNQELGY